MIDVFPVTGATSRDFADGWGNPRSGGRSHQGTDVFAPRGAVVVAPFDGTAQSGEGNLSGYWVRVTARDGRRVFIAHLAAPSRVGDGDPVVAGEPIGAVGNTGNAGGTQPHAHIEYRPTRTAPVENAYPHLEEALPAPPRQMLSMSAGEGAAAGSAGLLFGLLMVLALVALASEG